MRPSIKVSALNTFATLRFDAPIARRMPISFLRSSTLMYVMMPIMMELTTRLILTNAMSTKLMVFTMSVTEPMMMPM